MSAREVIATPHKVAVSVMWGVVTIELMCGDEYTAQVLHEDIIDRLRSGEGLTLSLEQAPALKAQGDGE